MAKLKAGLYQRKKAIDEKGDINGIYFAGAKVMIEKRGDIINHKRNISHQKLAILSEIYQGSD